MRFRFALLIILVFPLLIPADPGVSSNFTVEENVNTKKSLAKVWGNLLAGYQQARNAAKSMVRQMQLTSSLANSMEENLRAWENVAKRTEAVLHADIWDENPVTFIENLEENLFQQTDKILYYKIPDAKRASENLNTARRKWVENLNMGDEKGFTEAQRSQLATAKTLALGDDQRQQVSREKAAYDIRTASLLKTGARRDQMVYMTDNADANLSALGQSLRKIEDSKAKEMTDINGQLAENEFVLGNMESAQDMDRLELYSQILLAKATKYNQAGLGSYLALWPMVSLSDELERIHSK
jgi:hypothetical protein